MQAPTHNSHMESEVGSAMLLSCGLMLGPWERNHIYPLSTFGMNAKDYGPEDEKALRACDPNYWEITVNLPGMLAFNYNVRKNDFLLS